MSEQLDKQQQSQQPPAAGRVMKFAIIINAPEWQREHVMNRLVDGVKWLDDVTVVGVVEM